MYFKEINDLFERTGFDKRTDIPEFFIIKFSDIKNDTAYVMPPYQKDFYQITLIKNTGKAKIKINNEANENLRNTLSFLSPEHFYSWTRGDNTEGYLIYFKMSFLNLYRGEFKETFDFFDLTSSNTFTVSENSVDDLEYDFQHIYKELNTDQTYRIPILQSLLLALLFKIKGLEERGNYHHKKFTPVEQLVYQYKNLVNNCYVQEKGVNFYASKLHVSANYLNQVVKKQTGKTAKYFIQQKIITEAKKLLEYSHFSISELAFHLGFEEPTHFTRFFKSATSVTPKAFRDQIL